MYIIELLSEIVYKVYESLLTFLLFFQKLLLTADITAVALGKYVLTHGSYCLTGNDLASDSCLDRNFKKLSRNLFFELLTHLSSSLISTSRKYNKGKSIHFFFVDQDVQLDQI